MMNPKAELWRLIVFAIHKIFPPRNIMWLKLAAVGLLSTTIMAGGISFSISPELIHFKWDSTDALSLTILALTICFLCFINIYFKHRDDEGGKMRQEIFRSSENEPETKDIIMLAENEILKGWDIKYSPFDRIFNDRREL